MNLITRLLGQPWRRDKKPRPWRASEKGRTGGTVPPTVAVEGEGPGEGDSAGPSVAHSVNGTLTWDHAQTMKQDIHAMKACCDAQIAAFRETGEPPAAYYFWRVAVLSCKQQNHSQEVMYCQLFVDMMLEQYEAHDLPLETLVEKRVPSTGACDIYHRLPKAKARLARSKAA